MNETELFKLKLKIAEHLRDTMTGSEIKMYLHGFIVAPEINLPEISNSKKDYVYQAFMGAKESEIIKIAQQLNIYSEALKKDLPVNWQKTTEIKAFISHISQKKIDANKLSNALSKYGINSFVAHEDIEPTENWQEEIIKALDNMDIFISMHMIDKSDKDNPETKFSSSVWCNQEIGYALARKVPIIPIKFEEDPKGFISSMQALSRRKKTADVVASEIKSQLEKYPEINCQLTSFEIDDIPF